MLRLEDFMEIQCSSRLAQRDRHAQLLLSIHPDRPADAPLDARIDAINLLDWAHSINVLPNNLQRQNIRSGGI